MSRASPMVAPGPINPVSCSCEICHFPTSVPPPCRQLLPVNRTAPRICAAWGYHPCDLWGAGGHRSVAAPRQHRHTGERIARGDACAVSDRHRTVFTHAPGPMPSV